MRKPVLTGILPVLHQGKVRDTYALQPRPDMRLIHIPDSVSTHNVSHLSTIPFKGQVLLAITLFWERMLRFQKGTFTHTVAFGREIYDYLPKADYPADFHLQALIVRNVNMFPYEFIFRSRMAGSLWKDFYSQGKDSPYGDPLPPGMQLMDEFPQPIFTPTHKSASDEPVKREDMKDIQPSDTKMFQGLYAFMRKFALERGIDIIDTKFEGGLCEGRRTLADEWGTPDSSRFVDAASIQSGQEPRWLDKEFLRREAEGIWEKEGKGKFPIQFSDAVIVETVRRYHEIVERLTGMTLAALQHDLGIA